MKTKLLTLIALIATLTACEKTDPTTTTSTSDTPTISNSAGITFVNTSNYCAYKVTFNGLSYTVQPGKKSNAVYVQPGNYNYYIEQASGYPKSGDYSGKKMTYSGTVTLKSSVLNNFQVCTFATLTIKNTDSHPYLIKINDCEKIQSVTISSGKTATFDLDKGYYNIKMLQQDYFFYPTDYEKDITLASNQTIKID